jgi:hypothetical protein
LLAAIVILAPGGVMEVLSKIFMRRQLKGERIDS